MLKLRSAEMIFWLVMYTLGYPGTPAGSVMLHVGNFTTVKDCFAAAEERRFSPRANIAPSFVCVQANMPGTNPPPN
jgi:hypothetical protein